MITYTEFKNKWLGKGIDWDGSYGNQCMDVYRQYVKEVLGCPQSPPVQGAKNVWDTYLPEYFDRIANSPTGVPEQGDIVIWGMAPYGHIAVCDSATTATVTCFEQNWTELDGSGVTEIRKHSNYNNVLGWLKFKKQETNMITEEQQRILDFLNGKTEGQVREAFGALTDIPNLRKELETLKVFSQELSTKVADIELKLAEKEKTILSCQREIKTANSMIEEQKQTIESLTGERNNYKKWYEAKCEELKTLDKMTAWQHIRYGIKLLTVKK